MEATKTADPDRLFIRRDGTILEDIDQLLKGSKLQLFGRCFFFRGSSVAYEYRFISQALKSPVVKIDVHQKFSQYECPVISIYDGSICYQIYVLHHVLWEFAIYYYSQGLRSKKEFMILPLLKAEMMEFPFSWQIFSTFQESADGVYSELYFNFKNQFLGIRLTGFSITIIAKPIFI